MISNSSDWPAHQKNEVVSIIEEAECDGCRFLLRSDGTVWMGLDPELLRPDAPEYVRLAAIQSGALTHRGHRQIVRSLLDKADKLEAIKAS